MALKMAGESNYPSGLSRKVQVLVVKFCIRAVMRMTENIFAILTPGYSSFPTIQYLHHHRRLPGPQHPTAHYTCRNFLMSHP